MIAYLRVLAGGGWLSNCRFKGLGDGSVIADCLSLIILSLILLLLLLLLLYMTDDTKYMTDDIK